MKHSKLNRSTPGLPLQRQAARLLQTLQFVFALLALSLSTSLRADPTTQPAVDIATIDSTLKLHGDLKDGVYTITVPRTDLHLTIESMDVPTGAGIASEFHFYTCTCGKTRVIGEFILCDYETADVVDSLRDGFLIKIDAIAPMLTDEKPIMRIVRFHGEGHADELAKRIYDALDQTGDARMQGRKMKG